MAGNMAVAHDNDLVVRSGSTASMDEERVAVEGRSAGLNIASAALRIHPEWEPSRRSSRHRYADDVECADCVQTIRELSTVLLALGIKRRPVADQTSANRRCAMQHYICEGCGICGCTQLTEEDREKYFPKGVKVIRRTNGLRLCKRCIHED